MVVGTILHEGKGGPHFTQFFVLFWVGSAVITINSKLLGGNISFFQSVCDSWYSFFFLVNTLGLGLCTGLLYCTAGWCIIILSAGSFC